MICPHCTNDDSSMMEKVVRAVPRNITSISLLEREHGKNTEYLCAVCSKTFTLPSTNNQATRG
jgi:hypothetical protein